MYWIHILNLVFIYIMLATSLNLILGYAGMASMAHAAFYGIGAYIAAFISIHLGYNFLVVIAISMICVGIIGALLALPFIRIRDEYVILFTLSFQMCFYYIVMAFHKVTGGDSGLTNIPRPEVLSLQFNSPIGYFMLLLLFCTIFVIGCRRLVASSFGRVLKGIREDEKAVLSLGKNVIKFKVQMFSIGTAIAGGAGALFVYYSIYCAPDIFNLDMSILLIVMVILGGSANLWGSVVGAALLTILPESLTFIPGGIEFIAPLRLCIFGFLLIFFIRVRPEGLLPEYSFLNKTKSNWDLTEPTAEELVYDTNGHCDRMASEGDPILKLNNISKSFGGLIAVNNVSIGLASGKITAIVGPNGCGKTTLFNIITGFLRPDRGDILFGGIDIAKLTPYALPIRGLVRSWQDVRIFEGMTVLDNVLMGNQEQRGESILQLFFMPFLVKKEMEWLVQKSMKYLAMVGLDHQAMELAKNLSYAEQKLLAIARLLATEAKIILLDEPSSGIDQTWVMKLCKLIKKLAQDGKTICIVEHNFDVIREISNHVYFMNAGIVIGEGSPEDIISNPELSKIYFGI